MPSVQTAQQTAAALDLTPRQDRIERAIVAALRTNAPRSRVRAAVCELVDHLRLIGRSTDHIHAQVLAFVRRHARPDATDDDGAGFTADERLTLVSSWIAERTARAD